MLIKTDASLAINAASAVLKAPSIKAETLMLQVQILVARDFDEQMRHIGEQIRFLSDIKSAYRGNLEKLQNFMAQSPDGSRKDGRKYIPATFAQMANLFGCFKTYDYDLEAQTVTSGSLSLRDNGDKHDLDKKDENGKAEVPNTDGKSLADDFQAYFAKGMSIKDPAAARDFAKKAGSDNSTLPFYYGHTENTDESGNPLFAVYVDQLDRLAEEIKSRLSAVEEDTERLSVGLNQISAQRKAALDGANQLLQKMAEIRQNAISKIQ
jgi:hypothetical protein